MCRIWQNRSLGPALQDLALAIQQRQPALSPDPGPVHGSSGKLGREGETPIRTRAARSQIDSGSGYGQVIAHGGKDDRH
jgi:hypothetical protein